MRSVVLCLLWPFCSLLAANADGPVPQSTRYEIVAQDEGARMERLAAGVFAIIHGDATDQWPHGNTGVVVGDDGVLVIDSTYLPSRARADIALIRKVTNKPVRYLVMTHWHFDHNNGNVAYQEAFPDIAIVSERRTRDYIELNNTWWPKMSNAPDSARMKSLEKLEAELASGQDSAGKALTPEARKELENKIRLRRSELRELAAMKVVAPNLVFDHELTLFLGPRRIELRDVGRANSPHDVTIYLPEEQILFTGDILVQAPVPYFGSSWPVEWINVLKTLEATPVTALVPGHGPSMPDHTYTRQVRELLEAVTWRVTALVRQGKTLEQIQAEADFNDVRKRVAPWNAPEVTDDIWKRIMDAIVERAHRGVRGQG